ncbi:AraC family transcriptional regulator [Clostridium thailandense]|uniref:AraC family transcriptional regulator n=1 Tax=Clostridium thailandense TaxID=2794346 RepID=UPI00398A2C8A
MVKEKNKINFYRKINIEIVQGKSFHNFPKHSHNSFCIGIVMDGKIRLNFKGQEYLLEKNNVYFIPPFVDHKIETINKMQYEYTVICFNNDFIEQYNNILLYKYVYRDEKVGLKILNILKRFDSTDNYLQLENDIKQFWRENIQKFSSSVKPIYNPEVILAVNFIKEHLEESFDLNKISDYTHISKYHLLRLFEKQMGVAPYHFYIQEKVKKIRQELLKNQTPANLAYNLNFSDQSHLCNTFKKYIGLTPIQFKKSYKEDTN